MLIASERLLYILSLLEGKPIIPLKDVAKDLKISEITVRRDFARLEKEGRLVRVQGGAMRPDDFNGLLDAPSAPVYTIEDSYSQVRQDIAQRAAEAVQDGDCVLLDSGTSILPLAEILVERHVQLVTYNHLIVRNLKKPKAELFVIGGQLLSDYGMYIGPMVEQTLSQFHFDRAFFSTTGVDLLHGEVYATETQSYTLRQSVLERSTYNYLLADSEKLKRQGFVKLADLSDFDAVYCNSCETALPLPGNFILV